MVRVTLRFSIKPTPKPSITTSWKQAEFLDYIDIRPSLPLKTHASLDDIFCEPCLAWIETMFKADFLTDKD